MTKHRRYQLTERQLAPVIRYINENYPAGINDFNIDRLSGADRDVYDQIRDVTLKPNGSLIFDIVTDRGNTVGKEVWMGDDNIINSVESVLPKYGYDVRRFPEWEITNATMQGSNLVLDIQGDGHIHQVVLDNSTVFSWIPELESGEIEPIEPDPDRYRDDF